MRGDMDDDNESFTSEMYDQPNDLSGMDIEREPEFQNNISTSLFIKDLVEKMNRKAEKKMMEGGIFKDRANSSVKVRNNSNSKH